MSTTASAFPAPRVLPQLKNAFGGIMRLSWYRFSSPSQWWTTGCVLVVMVLLMAASVKTGQREAFLGLTTEFYLTFLLPIMAFLSGAGAIRDEMKGNAVDYILTRPVPRWAFLVFRYLAQLACLELMYVIVFAAVVSVGAFRAVPDLTSLVPVLFSTQVVTIAVFMCFGFFCGVLTNRYLVVGLIYGAIVEAGISRIPIQLNALSMTYHVRTMLHGLASNRELHFRHAANQMLGTATAAEPSALRSGLVLLGMTIAFLAVSATLFSQKELVGERSGES